MQARQIKFNDYQKRRQHAAELLSNNLAVLLAEKGWASASVKQLAAQCNQHAGQRVIEGWEIQSWRQGKRLPGRRRFELLADRLDCEEADLLPETLQDTLQNRPLTEKHRKTT